MAPAPHACRAFTALLAIPTAVAASSAHAAELRVEAPATCVTVDTVQRQVEALVGQRLAQLPALTFDVSVHETPRAGVRVVVRSFAPGVSRGERIIETEDCTEAGEAASVAVAMALSAAIQGGPGVPVADAPEMPLGEPVPAAQPSTRPQVQTDAPVPATEPPDDRTRISGSAAQVDPAPPRTPPSSPWGGRIGLGFALDAGNLPSPTPGFAIALQAGYHAVALRAHAGVFASQSGTIPTAAAGGEFGLATAGLEACFEPHAAPVLISACGGADAVVIDGEGMGDDIRVSRPRSSVFVALQAELAAGWPLFGGLSAWLRLAVGVPLGRPEFVLSGDQPVHQVPRITGRGLLGLEIAL